MLKYTISKVKNSLGNNLFLLKKKSILTWTGNFFKLNYPFFVSKVVEKTILNAKKNTKKISISQKMVGYKYSFFNLNEAQNF